MRTQRRSWRRFVGNGGVLWAEPGSIISVDNVSEVRSSEYHECQGWPGQCVLAEDQLAWAASSHGESVNGRISLLTVLSLRQHGKELQIRFHGGNPRQPVGLKGLLRDVMVDAPLVPNQSDLTFRRERDARRLAVLIESQRATAREKWPTLAVAELGGE